MSRSFLPADPVMTTTGRRSRPTQSLHVQDGGTHDTLVILTATRVPYMPPTPNSKQLVERERVLVGSSALRLGPERGRAVVLPSFHTARRAHTSPDVDKRLLWNEEQPSRAFPQPCLGGAQSNAPNTRLENKCAASPSPVPRRVDAPAASMSQAGPSSSDSRPVPSFQDIDSETSSDEEDESSTQWRAAAEQAGTRSPALTLASLRQTDP